MIHRHVWINSRASSDEVNNFFSSQYPAMISTCSKGGPQTLEVLARVLGCLPLSGRHFQLVRVLLPRLPWTSALTSSQHEGTGQLRGGSQPPCRPWCGCCSGWRCCGASALALGILQHCGPPCRARRNISLPAFHRRSITTSAGFAQLLSKQRPRHPLSGGFGHLGHQQLAFTVGGGLFCGGDVLGDASGPAGLAAVLGSARLPILVLMAPRVSALQQVGRLALGPLGSTAPSQGARARTLPGPLAGPVLLAWRHPHQLDGHPHPHQMPCVWPISVSALRGVHPTCRSEARGAAPGSAMEVDDHSALPTLAAIQSAQTPVLRHVPLWRRLDLSKL